QGVAQAAFWPQIGAISGRERGTRGPEGGGRVYRIKPGNVIRVTHPRRLVHRFRVEWPQAHRRRSVGLRGSPLNALGVKFHDVAHGSAYPVPPNGLKADLPTAIFLTSSPRHAFCQFYTE